MKIGVVGKGGAGKTTVAARLARAYAEQGRRVLAVDTDSNPNLGLSLGLDEAAVEAAPRLPRSLVVGDGEGALSPAQLVAGHGTPTPAGATLVQAMLVDEAAGGCMCGSHASVRSLLGAAIEEEVDVAVVDMEAGLEHLARAGGTLAYADVLLAVTDPTRKGVHAAARVGELAGELGIPRVYAVGNKAERDDDTAFFAEAAAARGLALAGVVPFDDDVAAEREPAPLAGDGAAAPGRAAAGAGRVGRAISDVEAMVDSPAEQRAALRRMRAEVEQRLAELGAS